MRHGRIGARSLLRAVILAVVAIFATPATAFADFNSGLYSHENSGCASRVDPITFVWFAGGGTEDRTLNHIRGHTGWGGGTGGGQYFASHGFCRATYGEAYNGGTETRYHVRLKQTHDWDSTYEWTTVGTPHYEIWVDCGLFNSHAVERGSVNGAGVGDYWSGFDNGRETIWNFMAGTDGHYWVPATNWGNTAEMEQCNGWLAGSNGMVYWLSVPTYYH